MSKEPAGSPIPKAVAAPSVFRPEALIREARRQRGLPDSPTPSVCILDPDGDIVRHLNRTGRARRFAAWPCYHSEMQVFALGGGEAGIVGCAVGAPYAVLVAEQAFASGCRLLISITSAGQIVPVGPTPYYVVIDKALRDEGTSSNYLTPGPFAAGQPDLVARAGAALSARGIAAHTGASWTTDAPFRETESAIAEARARGVLAVEMEAAGLYAFAAARGKAVLCLAHVTNAMAQAGDDFEKGEANGAIDSLAVLEALTAALADAGSA
jgi:uridine phosphorylase